MRCVVKFKDSFVNIEADSLVREESTIYAYNGAELVGFFDLGTVDYVYLSKKREGRTDDD